MSFTKNMTIGKIILSLIAIGVMFVPVYAVQSIEARAIDHALAVEGLYVNGTAIEVPAMTNDTMEKIEAVYPYNTNETLTYDCSEVFVGGGLNKEVHYRDYITYTGNGSYNVLLNESENPTFIYYTRYIIVPLDMNASDLMAPDFIRISSNFERTPQIWIIGLGTLGGASYGIPTGSQILKVATDEYIYINTLGSRSFLSGVIDNCGDNTQAFLVYSLIDDPDILTFDFKLQSETYQGADILTWTDNNLYIMAVVVCDIILIGAIVFASDPIDIAIDRPKRRR